MTQYVIALALLGLSLSMISLRKTFRLHTPIELKRRARAGDTVAAALYPAMSFGGVLYVWLWLVTITALAGSFWLLTTVAPGWLVFITEAMVIGYAFAWAPATRVSSLSVRLAVAIAPAATWLLTKTAPVATRLTHLGHRLRRPYVHTRLYEHDDLLELIHQQQQQSDSRIPAATLDMLDHMLRFDEKLVRDCRIPRRKVRMVAAGEPIGPALMQSLHESGFRWFPVYDGEENGLVGMLDLWDITGLKHTGLVRDAMTPQVYYLHETHPIEQVLDAFYKTGAHLFIVTDDHETFTGLVTIEDVLTHMLGFKIAGDFDLYDSRRAVAAYRAQAPAATPADKVLE